MKIINRSSATDPHTSTRRRRQRPTRRVVLLLATAMAAALIAACGNSAQRGGVAQINSQTAANRATTPRTKPNAEAYSQCMRAHGVPNFPDPNSSGQILLTPNVNTQTAAYQSAHKECNSLNPGGPYGYTLSQATINRRLAAALKFATCVRAHGVLDFPDPQTAAGGGLGFRVASIAPGGSSSGFDPNSPAFQRAHQKCRADLSAAGLGGGALGGS